MLSWELIPTLLSRMLDLLLELITAEREDYIINNNQT